jgi:hypothetical protein
MKPHYDDTVTQPLTSDNLIEARVSALVGRACRRQIWFLFLDSENIQLPLIMPVADLPALPDAAVTRLADNVAFRVGHLNARAVIIVLERYAGTQFSTADTAWARALDEGFAAAGLPVRAVLVSHSRGVRWFAADDYRWSSTGAADEIGTDKTSTDKTSTDKTSTDKISTDGD